MENTDFTITPKSDIDQESLLLNVQSFFLEYPLDKLHNVFWELYKGWVNHSAQNISGEEITDMILFYEEIKEVFKSVFELSSNLQIVATNNPDPVDSPIALPLINESQPTEPVNQSSPVSTAYFKDSLNNYKAIKPVVKFLVEVLLPEKIYVIDHNKSGNNNTEDDNKGFVDLIIIANDKVHSKPFLEFEPILEFASLRNSNIRCSLHNSGQVISSFALGQMFYLLTMKPEFLVYDNGSKGLPHPNLAKCRASIDRSRRIFNNMMAKADGFYKSAVSFKEENQHLTSFMLHQSAEFALRGLALALYGREKKTHSINALLSLVALVEPSISDIFPEDTKIEKELIVQLDEAYSNARYDVDFSMEREFYPILFERIGRLLSSTREVFAGQIESINKLYLREVEDL